MKYLVQWEIDLDADGPVEACEMAQEIMQDRHSTAWYFTVEDQADQRTYHVDLEEKNPLLD